MAMRMPPKAYFMQLTRDSSMRSPAYQCLDIVTQVSNQGFPAFVLQT